MSNENTNKLDKLVLDLFAKVQEKQKEIEKVEKPKWVTSCTIGYNPDVVTDRMNIQTVTDINKLVELYSFLLAKESAWAVACKGLEVNIPFKYMGYLGEQWFIDIKARVKQVGVNEKKKELAILQSRLDKLITTDQRRELELAEIQKLLE